jgi:phospholipid-translocating ATPase
MVLAFSFFEKNTFIDIVTVSFTSLIIVELLNVYSELHRLKIVTVLAEAITLALYICSLIFLRGYLNTGAISEYFIMQVIFIVLISWLPIHSARFLLRTYSPSESDKIMKKIKIRT